MILWLFSKRLPLLLSTLCHLSTRISQFLTCQSAIGKLVVSTPAPSHASHHYRPQTKFAKVMFLHLSVILFTGGGVSRPTPRGKVEGSGRRRGVSRPTPRGEVGGSGQGGV